MALRHYEILFLVHPDQGDQIPTMLERYTGLVKEGKGTIHRLEEWGRRQLSYTIDKIHKAYYILLNVECDQKAYDEIMTAFRFNDAILRHLTIRHKDAIKSPSHVMAGDNNTGHSANNMIDAYGRSSYPAVENPKDIDYKNVNFLKKYLTETGKIIPSRITGLCAKFQRRLGNSIRRARFASLLPYCDNHK
jgi:small subunit ribosomal protein S6